MNPEYDYLSSSEAEHDIHHEPQERQFFSYSEVAAVVAHGDGNPWSESLAPWAVEIREVVGGYLCFPSIEDVRSWTEE